MRLRRSCLAVPGSSPKMLAKAAVLAADQIFLDLEDAVSPLEKVSARDTIVQALNENDYAGKTRVVRVNGVTTQWCLGDLLAVVGGAGRNLDCVMVPKVEDAGQLHFVDHVLTHLETEHGIEHRIGIEAQIENGRGAMNIREIAQATPRLETLIFGPGDYAANMGVGSLVIGSIDPDYPGDQWHFILSLIVTAARAYGVQANLQIDRELTAHTSISAGYLHNRGVHIIMQRNLNVPTQSAAQDPVNLGRPNPDYGNITQYSGQGDGYYNGLTVSLQHRARWISGRISYTLSKAIDNTGNAFFSSPQNNFNLRDDRGPPAF